MEREREGWRGRRERGRLWDGERLNKHKNNTCWCCKALRCDSAHWRIATEFRISHTLLFFGKTAKKMVILFLFTNFLFCMQKKWCFCVWNVDFWKKQKLKLLRGRIFVEKNLQHYYFFDFSKKLQHFFCLKK